MSRRKFFRSKSNFNDFKYGIRNFKPFKNLQYIDIKPLTIICGTNNCGKSSLLQSLLLSLQSISFDDIYGNIINRFQSLSSRSFIKMRDKKYKSALLFEGSMCHLSDYENIINKYSTSKELVFSFEFQNFQFSVIFFNPFEEMIRAYVKKVELKGKGYDLELIARLDENNTISNYTCYIRFMNFKNLIQRCPLINIISRNMSLEGKFNDIYIEDYKLENVHILFNGYIPEQIILSIDVFFEIIENIFKKFEDNNKELEKLRIKLKEEFKFLLDRFKEKSGKYDIKQFHINNETFFNFHEESIITDFFQNLHYIGPLREAPRRFYQFFDLKKLTIGKSGEFAPQLLIVHSNHEIPSFMIYDIEDNRFTFKKYDPADLTLSKGLMKWAQLLDLPDIIPTKVEKTMFKLSINLPKIGRSVTLQDIGFGISQVLPVYVESLRMDVGHTLILEQPEIHLHPGMQSKLADFLLSMAASSKNFIVETHSEHIINRICLRIAQDPTNKLKNLVSIVFIEPPREVNVGEFRGSKINNIVLNKFGEIENWPVGFFDETDYDKILRAAIDKREREEVKSVK